HVLYYTFFVYDPVALRVLHSFPTRRSSDLGEVQLDVLRQRGVPVGDDEPVPALPVRIGGIMTHALLVQQVGERCERHGRAWVARSEEHTSELQSRFDLVCRLLLEKKKNTHS